MTAGRNTCSDFTATLVGVLAATGEFSTTLIDVEATWEVECSADRTGEASVQAKHPRTKAPSVNRDIRVMTVPFRVGMATGEWLGVRAPNGGK